MRTVAPVVPGTGSYDISLPSACARGCRVTALAPTANTPDNFGASVTQVSEIDAVIGASVRSHGEWRPVMSFADNARWRGDGRGPAAIGTAGAALSLDVRQTSGDAPWPSAVSAAIPTALPAVVASATGGALRGATTSIVSPPSGWTARWYSPTA